MITYQFGKKIIISTFNSDIHSQQLALKTFGVIPKRPTLKVSKKLLKARIYEDMKYLKESPIIDVKEDVLRQEEW